MKVRDTVQWLRAQGLYQQASEIHMDRMASAAERIATALEQMNERERQKTL